MFSTQPGPTIVVAMIGAFENVPARRPGACHKSRAGGASRP